MEILINAPQFIYLKFLRKSLNQKKLIEIS
jgi:hypothetical protein